LEPIPQTVEAPSADDLRQRVLGSFRGRVAPVPLPPNYRLAMSVVAVGMVMLPLIYAWLVYLVGYGVYEYLVLMPTPQFRGSGRAMLAAWALWASPALVGGILLAFLVKPLFARSAEAGRPRMLRRDQEPLLFEFVERVCQAVGAPLPKRIYVDASVNAHAGLHRGLVSLVGEDDLILILGLPLLAGLSLQQTAGVLAHEFGHFSQRAGMRISYLVRATNAWFARVVYQRDEWDDWMRRESAGSENLFVKLILGLSRGCIWLTRRLLLGLMWAGQAISCFMMRQMEYDADRYEARLVGSSTFEATMRDIRRLGLSHQKSLSDLEVSWRENRLADSLPDLIRINRDRMPADVRNELEKHARADRTQLFSTHPADEERCVNVRRETQPPVFQCDLPATSLFRDFAGLSRAVTLDYYKEVLGDAVKPDRLVAVTEVVSRRDRSEQESDALARFFQNGFNALRPVCFAGWGGAVMPTADSVREARSQAERSLPEMVRAGERYQKAFHRMISVRQAEVVIGAGFKVQPRDFDLPGADEGAVRRAGETTRLRLKTADDEVTPHERVCAARLAAALGLLQDPDVAARVDPEGEIRSAAPHLLETAVLLGGLFKTLRELHVVRAQVAALVPRFEGNEQSEALQASLRTREAKLKTLLTTLHQLLDGVAYPFDHADAGVTLQGYVFPADPARLGLVDLYSLSDHLLERVYEVYYRVMARLAHAAEKLEEAVGLEPLPMPGVQEA
jgi:Zn-dependent protease with chaperone function